MLAKLTIVSTMGYMRKRKQIESKITDAEWVLMRLIWERGQATAHDLIQALDGLKDWKPKTIKTLLRRLSDKNVLRFEQSGREYVFYPVVKQQEAEHAESKSFVQRIFGGKAVPFMASFLKDEKLSPKEISELKAILEQKEKRR